MTWYQLSRFSAIQKNWYKNFYEHFAAQIQHLMVDHGFQIGDASSDSSPFKSGIFMDKIFFKFSVKYKNDSFKVDINLIFKTRSLDDEVRVDPQTSKWDRSAWADSRLVSFETGFELFRIEYNIYKEIIKQLSSGHLQYDYAQISQSFYQPQNAHPYTIISDIKNDIIDETNDDDDDDDDQQPDEPSPYLNSPRNLQKVK